MVPRDRIAYGHQHRFKWQSRQLTSARISVVTWAMDINHDTPDEVRPWTQTWPSMAALIWELPWPQVTAQSTQISMTPGDSITHGHQYGFRQQPRPWASTSPSLTKWATDTKTDPGWSKTLIADKALGSSMDLDITIGSECSVDHLHQLRPHCHLQFFLFPQPMHCLTSFSLSFHHHTLGCLQQSGSPVGFCFTCSNTFKIKFVPEGNEDILDFELYYKKSSGLL